MSDTNMSSHYSSGELTVEEEPRSVQNKQNNSSRAKKQQKHTEAEIILRFASCGRCGLFLTSYRIDHNAEFLEAVKDIESKWLALPWHLEMRELVGKSFGCPIDIEAYFFEGSCPECYRAFSYAEPEPEQQAWFLIKL